ncbi:MAG TPA: sugar ABC transporter substrate-binding protein [Chloroflexota bacterium]|nr:sugar ABC transporter substrate-binding protein [Chloroflexota bacterium]
MKKGQSRRRLFSGAAALTGMGALAACGAPSGGGGGAGAGSGTTAKALSAKVSIIERLDQETQALDARLPAFKEKFPNITVEREVVPSGDLITKLQTGAASDTMPDNCHTYLGNQSFHNFVATGAFLNIDAMLARDKVDLKQWFTDVIDIMKIDGKQFGLPYKGQVLAAGFYYNINLFEKRGIPLPTNTWTYDDLIKASQQLTERAGSEVTQYGYAVNSWGGEAFVAHLRAFNGDNYSKDGKKSTMDTPEVLEAMQWYENLMNRERIMHPIANAAVSFVDGKVAMIGRTYFNFKTVELLPKVGDKFKWDGVMMPKHPKTGKRGGMFAGDAQSIAKASKAPDAAFELMKWITDKEMGVALGLQTKGSTTLGGRPDVWADPRILNHPQLPRQAQQVQLDSIKEIKEPYSAPFNFRAQELEPVRDPETRKITDGQAKAEASFLKTLNGLLQPILDKPRPGG